jgi:signal transduction histidine kinase/DNA-binding response OmpR family regulator
MALATVVSFALWFEVLGETAAAFSSLTALATAFITAPVIALVTRGRFYIARNIEQVSTKSCTICCNRFDAEDMLDCPFHAGTICSLCCSLDARCDDICKPEVKTDASLKSNLPLSIGNLKLSAFRTFLSFFLVFVLLVGVILLVVYQSLEVIIPDAAAAVGHALTLAFGLLCILVGVVAWLYALSQEARDLAQSEREAHNRRLLEEISAHEETDAALQRAKDAAEAANEAKSRYLLGITHELRTPLNAILGYAQPLETDPTLPEHRHGAVKVIRRSSEHLADLIEGLLDVSKIEAGRLDVTREEINLREVLEQLNTVFTMEAGEKGLEFTSQIDSTVPDFIFGDEKRLRQILINLLSNAVRYTEAGSVSLLVSFRNDTAKFSVRDTGRGIAPSMQNLIFAPFERVEDPQNPIPGTGLGLTITKLLVEIMGGELTLDSAPGEGSCFEVVLYLSRSDRVRTEKAKPIRTGYAGPNRRILICDDSSAHRRLMEDALAPLGFEISMAETGEIALEFCRAQAPDLALIDQAMPGISGSETCAQIREAGLDIPLIIVSANADIAPKAEVPHHSHNGYLSKPVNVEQLLDLVGTHLHLEWTHETAIQISRPSLELPHDLADALSAAVEIGHMATVRAVIQQLTERDGYANVAEHAVELANRYDLPGLRRLSRRTGHVG